MLMTLSCAVIRPTFLLVDVVATYQDKRRIGRGGINLLHGTGFICMYVLAPEKFVAYALFMNKSQRFMACLLSVLLDSCGVLALIVGISTGELTVALGIGYAATAFGFAFAIGVVVCEKCCMREPR